MNFDQTSEFKREFKKFSKKWLTLPDDLATFEQVVRALYIAQTDGPNVAELREAFFGNKKATVLRSISPEQEVVKARLDCQALNKDQLRVTYIRTAQTILFVELYSKADKNREDQRRVDAALMP